MKQASLIRKLTATVLAYTLCCTGMTVPDVLADDGSELPARFDLREADPPVLTPVKNQSGGTCWAHTILGCIESNMIMKGMADNTLDLSETHLVWFTEGQDSPTDPDDLRYGGGINIGVKAYDAGPSLHHAIEALASWQGVVPEDLVPSHAEKPVLDESLRYQSAAHLQNAGYCRKNDISDIKQHLLRYGPLYTGYFNDHDHPLSEKSAYYDPDYTREASLAGKLNGRGHAVMIVGWDDAYPKTNFNDIPPEDGAWICKNSWGNYENSENGYFYMSYAEPSINTVIYFDTEPVTNYGSVYSYNSSKLVFADPADDDHGFFMANVFEAEQAETLAAVGALFRTKNSLPAEYELSVYLLSDDAANPQDGTLATKIEGVVDHTEYRTIRLPQCIEIREGQKYAIVLKLPPGIGSFYDSKCYKAGVSYSAEYAAKNEAAKPEWNDCYTVGTGDVCIHVYTKYEGETEQIIPGDMNRNGRLTAADLSLMKQAIRQPERSDLYQPAADWNGDSEINAEDARGLLSFLLRGSDQDELKI